MSAAPRKRKPTIAVRVANRLGKLAPAQVKALLEATQRLRRESGEGLRQAMREQREALAALAETVDKAALEEGTKPTLVLQRRVQNIVRAAAVQDPAALSGGTLAEEMQPAGFDSVAGIPLPRHQPKSAAAPDERRRAAEEKRRARELRIAEQVARRAAAKAQQLAQRAEQAEKSAAEARARAQEAQRAADEEAARALALRQS